MRRLVSISVLFVLGYLLVYYALDLILFRKKQVDLVSEIYAYHLSRDSNELREVVLNGLMDTVSSLIAEKEEEDRNHEQYDRMIQEAMTILFMFTIDEGYAEKCIDDHKKSIKRKLIARKIWGFTKCLLLEFFHLIPILVWVVSGDIFIGIVASGLVMLIHSIVSDFLLGRSLSNYLGEEVAEEYYKSATGRVSMALSAFAKQSHFYVLLVIDIITN